jgi:PIN domain nuclease of toxin-antitoxin system
VSEAGGSAVLLDTCALIWLLSGAQLAAAAEQCILEAGLDGSVLVSPVSAWEIGLLARPRPQRPAFVFMPDPKTWFMRALAQPGMRLTPQRFSPESAVDASRLPEPLHADPADRMLIASARYLGVPIVTRDQRIIAYGVAGHVGVVPCLPVWADCFGLCRTLHAL